ncbi:MAG: ATP-binding protein [Deltaproteobacteria bacterium]|nr:ATP-binding protein [Deltaproteobacteria bacterium]
MPTKGKTKTEPTAKTLLREIEALREKLAKAEQSKKKDIINQVAHGIAGAKGDTLFQSLVKYLTKTLNVEYAFIGELAPDRRSIETIALCRLDKIIDNITYDLSDTPCHTVLPDKKPDASAIESCVYADSVQENFPKDELLTKLNIKSYAGIPLVDSRSRLIGILVVLDTKPMADTSRIKGLLKILSGRASTELQRVRIEKRFRDNERLLAEAQRIAKIGSWEWDLPKDKMRWSEETARIFKLPRSGEWTDYETFLRHVHYEDKNAVKKALAVAIDENKPVELESKVFLNDGTERIVIEKAEIFYDKRKRPYRVAGTVRDITEEKVQAAEVLKAQRLESIGILAGGLAHDFSNLLCTIIGSIEAARPGINAEAREILELATKAAEEANGLCKQLIAFVKGSPETKETFGLKTLIEDTAAFSLAGTSVTLKTKLCAGLWSVVANKSQISQVMINLLINASQSMPEGGDIAITAENIVLDNGNPKELSPGNYVSVRVSDTGPGIPEVILKKIFTTYFTTKKKGSGIGLATCKTVIEKHGGTIEVESTPGSGTAFTFFVPASLEASNQPQQAQTESIHRENKKVLIMDDDARIRSVMKKMLSAMGYESVLTANGEEAVRTYKEALSKEKFGAVIMDLTVTGGMGGEEAMNKITDIDPSAKIILSSGYADELTRKRYSENASPHAVLPKPFGMAELARVLTEILGQARLS